MRVTPYAELDALLGELVARGREILGADWVGGYLQGSFALGAGDLTSDCDFVMVVREPPRGEAERLLRELHAEIPTRDGFWCGHLEGSYAVAEDLRSLAGLGREWLYVDHGWREMQWSTHCNNEWTRWTLRERGITLDGPPPATLVDPVPPRALRARMRAALPTLLDDLATWVDIETNAWGQRYAVMTAARQLYTLATGEVTSKPEALRWAMATLDPEWEPLLQATLRDRSGFDPVARPDPAVVARTREFVRDAARRAVHTSG